MSEVDWVRMAHIAGRVASSIALQWPFVESDDVKQTILLHAYERRPMMEKHWGNEAFVWAFARKAGTQYASAQRDAQDVTDGRYYYTPEEARMALATFIYSDEELGAVLGKQDDLLGCRVTDNLMSARLDASKAINRLPAKTRELVMRRYVYGMPHRDDTERKAANRGLDALARQMNRDLRKESI